MLYFVCLKVLWLHRLSRVSRLLKGCRGFFFLGFGSQCCSYVCFFAFGGFFRASPDRVLISLGVRFYMGLSRWLRLG